MLLLGCVGSAHAYTVHEVSDTQNEPFARLHIYAPGETHDKETAEATLSAEERNGLTLAFATGLPFWEVPETTASPF